MMIWRLILDVNDESTSAPSLRSFTIPDPLSNVILIVDDVSLYVHKEVRRFAPMVVCCWGCVREEEGARGRENERERKEEREIERGE